MGSPCLPTSHRETTMAIDDESRHELFVLLERDTSRETAAALMRHLPVEGWPDFATKDDLAVLRSDFAVLRGEVRADIHAAETRIIRWTVSVIIAAVAAAVAVATFIA